MQHGEFRQDTWKAAHYLNSTRDQLERNEVHAYYLEPLLEAWDAVSAKGFFTSGKGFFNQARQLCLLMGQGRVMLDFWKAVNALEDHSSLYPAPPPGIGQKKKQREEKPLTALVPAYDSPGARR